MAAWSCGEVRAREGRERAQVVLALTCLGVCSVSVDIRSLIQALHTTEVELED